MTLGLFQTRLRINIVLVMCAIQCTIQYNVPVDQEDEDVYQNINTKYLQGYLKQRQALEKLKTKFEAVCPDHSDDLEVH